MAIFLLKLTELFEMCVPLFLVKSFEFLFSLSWLAPTAQKSIVPKNATDRRNYGRSCRDGANAKTGWALTWEGEETVIPE